MLDKIVFATCIPNIECIIAKANGIIKNIPICLNNALFITFSSVPIFLKISYLWILSELYESSFNESIAAPDIKNIIPKYNPINVTIAPSPILAS